MKPRISILVPTFNREKFISKTIDSVLFQNYQNFEIICSDNASTDKTYEILKEYARKYSKIIVLRNDKNLGPVLNWKKCLDNASGDYIHWLWSDDWIEPNFYMDAFKLMAKDGTRAITTWNYRSDNPEDTTDKYISWQFSFHSVPSKIAARKIICMSHELPVSPAAYILPSKLVRENFCLNIPKLSDKLDPVNKGVGVDSLMVIGTCQNIETLSVLQKPSVVFRKHDNISTRLSRDGSLGKMYYWAHLWYASRNDITFSFNELFMLILRVTKCFKLTIFTPKIINTLLIICVKSVFSNGFLVFGKKYKSNKAVLNK